MGANAAGLRGAVAGAALGGLGGVMQGSILGAGAGFLAGPKKVRKNTLEEQHKAASELESLLRKQAAESEYDEVSRVAPWGRKGAIIGGGMEAGKKK